MNTGFDNRMVWQRQPGHYEVWYMTLTHRPSRTGFWIRYTLNAPLSPSEDHQPYAQLWFARGDHGDPARTFGINRRFPISALRAQDDPFSVRIGEARLGRDVISGALSGLGHDVSWDLRYLPVTRTHLHLPTPLYLRGGRMLPTVVLSPNLSVPVRGVMTVDGQRYEFDGEPAGQTHLWGRKHAFRWAWAHCNAFDRGDSPYAAVLEALTVQMRRGPLVLPRLTLLSVYPDGLSGEELSFRELWHLPRNRSEYRTGFYQLVGENGTARAEVTLRCRPEDMVRAEYVDPDGDPAYCHNTVVSACEVVLSRRPRPGAAWERWRTLATDSGAHWEWGGRAGDQQVKRRHATVDEA